MKKALSALLIFVLSAALLLVGAILLMYFQYYVWGSIFLVLFVMLSVVFFVGVGLHNKTVACKNKIDQSLALVDIQLKLRFDLVPNLVEVVKGYVKHENEIIEMVLKYRNLGLQAKTEQEKLEYANKLIPALKNLVAVSENYPVLQSHKLYKNLMEQLVEIEENVCAARRIYDINVNEYNSCLDKFPNNLVAALCCFEKQQLFKIDAAEKIIDKIS